MSSEQAEGTQECHIHGTREGDTVTVEAVNGQVNSTLNVWKYQTTAGKVRVRCFY